MVKDIYEKLTADIIFRGEKVKAFFNRMLILKS